MVVLMSNRKGQAMNQRGKYSIQLKDADGNERTVEREFNSRLGAKLYAEKQFYMYKILNIKKAR
jgi:hypothetical protein